MISMTLDARQDQISRTILNRLGDKTEKVITDATNRTLAGMRTDVTRLIVKKEGIIRKTVFSAITINKANASGSNGSVDIMGGPLGLIKYKHTPKKEMKGKTKGGVKVSINQQLVQLKSTFVAIMPNGHKGVFERQRGIRTDSGNTKIEELWGASIPQIAARHEIVAKVQENAAERFLNRFTQQSNRWLGQNGAA